MYLHAINLVQIAEDKRGGIKAPPNSPHQGVPLLRYLQATALPRSAWTLDEALHDPSHVTALKSAADVCLHASKTEGFGLNALECTATSTSFLDHFSTFSQLHTTPPTRRRGTYSTSCPCLFDADWRLQWCSRFASSGQLIGTPVVTTRFSAMADYTFNGISVPHRQLEWMLGGLVATPDVKGVAEALATIRALSPDKAATNAKAAQNKIRKYFSSNAVAKGMDGLIKSAVIAHSVRPVRPVGKRHTLVTDDSPPEVHWDTPWTLLSSKDIKIDADRVEQVLAYPGLPKSNVYIVPYLGPDGRPGPIVLPGSKTVHPNLPVLINTHMFSHAQVVFTSRHAITALILSKAETVKRLPDGIATAIASDRVEL